jgi:hypothetical protein
MTTRFHDGQRYELVRTEAYTRRDGGHTILAIWRSACPTCGEMFETRTPVRARRFSCRRCPRHRRPGVRVKFVPEHLQEIEANMGAALSSHGGAA